MNEENDAEGAQKRAHEPEGRRRGSQTICFWDGCPAKPAVTIRHPFAPNGVMWACEEHNPLPISGVRHVETRVKLDPWVSVGALPPGALFRTRDGILAVKSEYHLADGRSQCVLLASGEYAWFPNGDREEAQELSAGECAYLVAQGTRR